MENAYITWGGDDEPLLDQTKPVERHTLGISIATLTMLSLIIIGIIVLIILISPYVSRATTLLGEAEALSGDASGAVELMKQKVSEFEDKVNPLLDRADELHNMMDRAQSIDIAGINSGIDRINQIDVEKINANMVELEQTLNRMNSTMNNRSPGSTAGPSNNGGIFGSYI